LDLPPARSLSTSRIHTCVSELGKIGEKNAKFRASPSMAYRNFTTDVFGGGRGGRALGRRLRASGPTEKLYFGRAAIARKDA
jgi:hypothetical protein